MYTPARQRFANAYARWQLDLDEINDLVKLTATTMPEMLLPMQLVGTTGSGRLPLRGVMRERPPQHACNR